MTVINKAELAPKLGPYFIMKMIPFANPLFLYYYPVYCLSKFIRGLIDTSSVVIKSLQRKGLHIQI